LDVLRFRQLVARSREVGERTLASLSAELSASRGVVAVRGAGLMIGIELETPELAARATRRLLESGFISLTGGTQGEVITWTPALTIDEALLRDAGTALRDALASG
jgi:4-aminobutyrate aminotransferase/(S)-3-amino-2-methylpropionate transaminase